MGGLTITLDERALRRYLGVAEKRWPDAAGRALEKVGRLVFEESQREVPVGATGRLKADTVFTVMPREVTISYQAPYARIVHYRRRIKHPTGKRLFVTRPLSRGKRILPAEIEQAIQEAIDHMGAGV